MAFNIKTIDLENLKINLHNPRYDPRTSEREALTTIINHQGPKLTNLAGDIVMAPTTRCLVVLVPASVPLIVDKPNKRGG